MGKNIKKKTFKMRKEEINLNTVNCKNMYHRFKTWCNKHKQILELSNDLINGIMECYFTTAFLHTCYSQECSKYHTYLNSRKKQILTISNIQCGKAIIREM